MASQFMYVLGAGLAIFVVGGLLATYAPGAGVPTQEAGDVVFSEALGRVGGATEATSRTAVSLNEVVVAPGDPNATPVEGVQLSASAGAFDRTVAAETFKATRPRRAWITFVPVRGTDAAHLNISLNGRPLDIDALSTGQRVTLPTDAVKAGTNTLRVAAEKPPAWQFWASRSYTLEDVTVTVADAANEQVVAPFRAFPYEVNGFDRGELSYTVGRDVQGTAPLRIAVNGRTISERRPLKRASPYEVTFFANTTGLRPGENTLTLSTTGTARYPLDNVQLTLFFYAGTARETVDRTFNLSGSQYRRLGDGNGRIRYTVERVLDTAPLEIALPNRTYTSRPTPGVNTLRFGKADVRQGANTVQLSTTGAYRISAFNISITEE